MNKYTDMFKSWIFWVTILVYSIYGIYLNKQIFGDLFLVEYLGIFIASFIWIFLIANIVFCVQKIYKKLVKKKRNI